MLIFTIQFYVPEYIKFAVKVDHRVLCAIKKDLPKGTSFTHSKPVCLCNVFSQKNCSLASMNHTDNSTQQASAPTERAPFFTKLRLSSHFSQHYSLTTAKFNLPLQNDATGCCTCVCVSLKSRGDPCRLVRKTFICCARSCEQNPGTWTAYN